MDSSYTLWDVVKRYSRESPSKLAIVDDSHATSWIELDELTTLAERVFRATGIQPGDRVAVATEHAATFLAACAASSRCGAMFVPVSTRASAASIQGIVEQCRPRILIHDPPLLKSSRSDVASCYSPQELFTLDASLVITRGRDDVVATTPPSAPFMILYTSGTTRNPKGVVRSYATCATWWSFLAEHDGLSKNTVTLVATPLYSGMTVGTVLPTLVAGGTCVFMYEFDPRTFIEASKQHAATFCSLAPTHWTLLLAHKQFSIRAFASYTRMVSGGARLDRRTKAELIGLFPTVFSEVYGTSESGAVTDLPSTANADKIGSVGIPLRDTTIRIDGADGPLNEGEVMVKTSRLMSGYFNNESASASAWWIEPGSGERFYRTGDVGRVDPEGYLWLSGRRDDMIVTGGFNVHSSDIEAALLACDDVTEAVVVGREDPVLGQIPLAFVVVKPHSVVTGHILCRWVNQRLSKHQRVCGVQLVASIPKNAAGKPLKRELQKLANNKLSMT